jgi:hypothetical protein
MARRIGVIQKSDWQCCSGRERVSCLVQAGVQTGHFPSTGIVTIMCEGSRCQFVPYYELFFLFFLIFLMPFSGVGFFYFTYGSFRHLVGLLGWGISPAPKPLPTQDNTTQRNTDTHPCPEQDSNLRPLMFAKQNCELYTEICDCERFSLLIHNLSSKFPSALV